MRSLKIASKNIELEPLENVPEDFKFVESIARQNARTNEELKDFYLAGIIEAKELKEKYPEEFYKKNVVWAVRQSILEKKQK
jgi:hypothetical protein